MPTLSKVLVSWSGSAVVGGGVSVFYCNEGDEATTVAALHTFYNAIRSAFPNTLQWTFPTSGDTLDELSGTKVGAWSGAGAVAVTGDGSGTYANGVGCRVIWPTIGVIGGRSVVGSTFLAPLVIGTYEGSGNIQSATLSFLVPAAVALGTTANGIRVYSRKSVDHGGISFPVLTGDVPDKVSWLRSRRT